MFSLAVAQWNQFLILPFHSDAAYTCNCFYDFHHGADFTLLQIYSRLGLKHFVRKDNEENMHKVFFLNNC